MADVRSRIATIGLVAALLASGPLLPGRGDGDPVAPPTPAASSFSLPRGVFLARVYPNAARDDEFVELGNGDAAPVELSGWSLSDREGTARFPDGTLLPPGGRIVATRNGTSYAEDVLAPAQFTWDRGDLPRMSGDVLRLADAGDEVLLIDPGGNLTDAYVYGDSDYAGPGWSGVPANAPGRGEVAVRGAGGIPEDRDTADDWEGLRRFRLGQSDFRPTPVEVDGPVVPVVSPRDGPRVLSLLASARSSIHAAVYTLTSASIASVLADRARHGVRVRLLLEAAPVGGVEESEARLVAGLVAAGAEVRWLSAGDDLVKRYRYLHAKYAIVDGEGVLVGSENFGDAGFPPDGGAGNRGWSLIVRDPELASELRDVFDEDFDPRRRDTVPAVEDASVDLGPPPAVAPWTWPSEAGQRTARLVVGPDTVLDPDGLLGLLESAMDRLWVQAFYVEEAWGNGPNPLLEAAFAAARRGVDVRLLLDPGYWDAQAGAPENEAVMDRINERARAEGIGLEVRLLDVSGDLERLHNKGVVVDGRAVLVSSVNWALTSATENREMGLLLEDEAVARLFESVFAEDWDGRRPLLDLRFLEDPAILLGLYAFVGVASAASLRSLRRGDKGLSPRDGMETRGLRRASLRRGHREVRLLPPELVAEPRARARGGGRDRPGGEEARGGLEGPEGD